MPDHRRGYDMCTGPYTWASGTRDQGAHCSDGNCRREHPDHARRLAGDGGLTDFCVICMEDHQ